MACRIQWIRATLALTGRSDLLRSHYISSCEDTSQHLSEASCQQQAAALSLLGLSQRQHQRLADGYVVFQGLLKRVIQEMQQQQQQQQQHSQQQQQQQQNDPSNPSSGILHANGYGNGSGGSSSSGALVQPSAAAAAATANGAAAAGPAHEAYKRHLGKQQDFTRRMTALLNTDMRMRVAVMAYMFGCFTWPQMAELHVLTWPYSQTLLCCARLLLHS
jgi:transcription initiation factor TFIID subunit TAF12